MKTVREVAKELNVSRQSIYNKLTDNFKRDFTTVKLINSKEVLVISTDGVTSLKKSIANPSCQADSQVDSQHVDIDSQVDNPHKGLIDKEIVALLSSTIETLQGQLDSKDEQIKELNQHLTSLTERLKEAQDLNKNNQILLHRQQDTKLIESTPEPGTDTSWFKKIFRKN